MKCQTCQTPQHLFYNNKCPRCQSSKLLSHERTALWYTLYEIAQGADPRCFEYSITFSYERFRQTMSIRPILQLDDVSRDIIKRARPDAAMSKMYHPDTI